MKKYVSVLLSLVLMFGIMPMAYAGMGSGTAPTPDPKYLPYSEVGPLSEGLAWYCECGFDDNYGYIDTTGKVVINAKYQTVFIFSEGLAKVQLDGKWGYIDKTGKEVVKPQYDEVADEFRDGMAQVLKNNKWGYVDKTGKEVIALQYEDTNAFGDGLAHVKKDNKFGYIDKTGKEVIKPQYTNASKFGEGLAPVQVNEKWGFIDKTGKEVIKGIYNQAFTFSEGLAGVQLNGKWGFVDKTGNEVIKPQYDKVYDFSDGLAPVLVNNLWGYIDKTGKEVIKPQYAEIKSRFSEGLATVSKNKSFIDKNGKEYIYPQDGYIDKTGKEIIAFQDDFSGTVFSNGLAVVADGGQGSFYFIANPLTSKTPVNDTPANKETRIDINGSKGSYISLTNVVEQHNAGDSMMYVANAPVTITFHGDDLFFENIATLPDYERVPFEVKKYMLPPDTKVLDELVQKPEGSNSQIYVTDNYATITNPGDYGVYAAPQGTSSTPVLIRVTQSQDGKEPSVPTKPVPVSAAPTASKVLINGKEISFEAYNIKGNNYFKLRDLAMAVNGTTKNFEVGFDSTKNAINLLSGQTYTSTGGELVVSDKPTSKDATPTNSKIYLDGKEVQLTAFNIAGNNYFKLRDIAKLINVGVTFDGKTNTIGIDSKSDYKE